MSATILPAFVGAYTAPIEFEHSAADAATAVIWNLRGPVSNLAYIKSIRGVVCFDGTAAAATTLRYGFYRGAGAASPTGGTAITPQKKQSGYPNSTLVDLQSGAVLTTAGITYGANAFAVAAVPVSISNGVARFDFQFDKTLEVDSALVIGPDEHLGILLQTSAVIGLGIYGMVEWDERTPPS